jgi:hypothetical protein
MFGKKQTTNEQLDRVGRALVHAAAANNDAIERAATAPFLYARVRARIAAAEQARRNEADEGWLALLAISRRAVPALSAVAAVMFALMLWLASGASAPAATGFGDEAYYGSDAGVERTVLADTSNLSRDEVLTIVVEHEEQGRR